MTVVPLAETTVSNKARYSNQSLLSPWQTPVLKLPWGLGSMWRGTALVPSKGTPDFSVKCGYHRDIPGSLENTTCECLKYYSTGDRMVYETRYRKYKSSS